MRELQRYKDRLDDVTERAKQQAGTHHDLLATVAPDAEAIDDAIREGDYPAFRAALTGYEAPVRARRWPLGGALPGGGPRIGKGLQIDDLVEDVFLTALRSTSIVRAKCVSASGWAISSTRPSRRWRRPGSGVGERQHGPPGPRGGNGIGRRLIRGRRESPRAGKGSSLAGTRAGNTS